MLNKMKAVLCVVAAVMLLGIVPAHADSPDKLSPGDFDFTLTVGKLDRHYIVHVPASYDGTTPTPVVIMLHGAGGNSKNALVMGRWIPKSDAEGFLAVALDGVPPFPRQTPNLLTNPQLWNDGSERGPIGLANNDDIGFISAVMDDLIARGSIDQKRIYVTGFSNGASMTFRAGAELSKRIAAIAPVSGHLFVSPTQLDQPISMLLITGDQDPLNPLNGGLGENPWGGKPRQVQPMKDSVDAWAKLLNCPTDSTTIYNQPNVKGIAYSPCDDNTEAQFYLVSGMGHDWPGGINYLPVAIIGPRSNAINATDVIWDFFVKHPKP